VDPYALVILSSVGALVLFVWLLGKYYPGSGLEQIGMRSAREIAESREELEAQDLDQMIEAHNERRRARGEAELTATDIEMRVMNELREQQQRREQYLADRELDQLLEATNARRRKRGLPERTREQAKQEFGGGRRDER
jgi:transcription initiation factor TFIIIB Brf1 subunit/transcription initiation factor TFIIB